MLVRIFLSLIASAFRWSLLVDEPMGFSRTKVKVGFLLASASLAKAQRNLLFEFG
jgi:hypothetical protein